MKDLHTKKIENVLRQHFDRSYKIDVDLTLTSTVVTISHTKNLSRLVIFPDAFQTAGVWLLDVNLIYTIQNILLTEEQKALYKMADFMELKDLTKE